MGSELDKADSADDIYIFGDRSVHVGDWYDTTMAKCGSARSSIYAINVDNAIFQENLDKKEQEIPVG